MAGERKMEAAGGVQVQEPIGSMAAFAFAVKRKLELAYPSSDVEIHGVQKNNNLQMIGVAIREKDRNVAPEIYLEEFFEQHQNGKSLDEICRTIGEIHQRLNPDTNFDVDEIKRFPAVKDRICYELVNAEKNADWLKDVPYRLWQDLAVVYYILVPFQFDYGISSIRVSRGLMELWGVDEPVLYERARVNTPALLPVKALSLADVAGGMLWDGEDMDTQDGMLEEDSEPKPPFYLVSNNLGVKGAVIVLYDDILEKFSEYARGDFYIIPCSVDEMLFFPVLSVVDGDWIRETVQDINASSAVPPQNVLSDNAYRYYAEDGCVRQIA